MPPKCSQDVDNKIKAAARARMAKISEPYTATWRAVPAEQQLRSFPISSDTHGLNWITKYADTLLVGDQVRPECGSTPIACTPRWDLPVRRTASLDRNVSLSTEKLHRPPGVRSYPSTSRQSCTSCPQPTSVSWPVRTAVIEWAQDLTSSQSRKSP